MLLPLLGTRPHQHFPLGLSEDSLLLSPKRARFNASSSAVPKARTSAHLLPPPLHSACFREGVHPCSSPQGARLLSQGLWRRELTLNEVLTAVLCVLVYNAPVSPGGKVNFYRGPI